MTHFEPERLFCTAGECLQDAVVTGRVTLQVSIPAGVHEDESLQTFDLPMCTQHAHLMSHDTKLVYFHNGIHQDLRGADEH